jgi:predicted phospho-2-dehydro-3-deoxyheptonate aldolase
MYGKTLRLARLISGKGKTCMVPIDHGTTIGPVDGLKDYISIAGRIISGGADAIILHKGLLREVVRRPELTKGKYIMHLSASTILGLNPDYKVLVGSVEEAVKLGVDGVSVHINLGIDGEIEMLKDLGRVARDCFDWGMPLLAMMYCLKNPSGDYDIAHAARLAEELGADMVKVNYPGSISQMENVLSGVRIPVIIAGGDKTDRIGDLLSMINDALMAGAAGVAIGRNIFQHNNPEFITRLIRKLVHGESDFQECLAELEEIGTIQ